MFRRRLALTFALAAPLTGGCMTTYSSDPAGPLGRGQASPDYIKFLENDAPSALTAPLTAPLKPPPSLPETPKPAAGSPSVPGQGTVLPPPPLGQPIPAGATITPVNPEQVYAPPPRRSLWQRVFGKPLMETTTGGMTLPSPHYLKNPPQYFPAEPAFPLQRESAAMVTPQVLPASVTGLPAMLPPKGSGVVVADAGVAAGLPKVVMPTAVAPPTPEQVNAVPLELVKALQTGAFDPNVVPAGGKLPAISPPPAPNNLAAPSVPANPLDGTVWVRELKLSRAIVKFTRDRVEVTVTAGQFTLHAGGDYAPGKDGVVFGVVTRADSPTADDPALLAKLAALDGSPFCVRVRVEDGTLTLRDFRCAGVEPTAAVLGAYRKTTAAELEKQGPQPGKIYGPAFDIDLRLPPAASPAKPTPAGPRSSLDAAVEFVQAFCADNPQLVQVLAAELGRAVGGWVGDETGQPRLGEVVGSVIGSAVAAKLTGQPAAPVPPSPEFRSVKALSYWLGAERPTKR